MGEEGKAGSGDLIICLENWFPLSESAFLPKVAKDQLIKLSKCQLISLLFQLLTFSVGLRVICSNLLARLTRFSRYCSNQTWRDQTHYEATEARVVHFLPSKCLNRRYGLMGRTQMTSAVAGGGGVPKK